MLPELDLGALSAVPASPTAALAIRAIELDLMGDLGGSDAHYGAKAADGAEAGADVLTGLPVDPHADLSSLLDDLDELHSSSESSDSGYTDVWAASPPRWDAGSADGDDGNEGYEGDDGASMVVGSPPTTAAELAPALAPAPPGVRRPVPGRWRRTVPPRTVQPRRFDALVQTVTAIEEEKLKAAGIELPARLPVSKAEEKRVRGALRKIRNKASAQRSRKNKEVYIAELEGRMDEAAAENSVLAQQVTDLSTENRSLLAQLDELRAAVTAGLGRARAGGATLMVALLCVGLGATGGGRGSGRDWAPAGRRSRTLLSADSCAGTDWPCAWLAIAAAAVLVAAVAAAALARTRCEAAQKAE